MAIRFLSKALITKIAAGEVIDRPSSVMKELVENSLDASSTTIVISLRGGGKSYLAVTDNGVGMSRDDLILSVERHASSKIPDDDLFKITTLGFRGEALPAIQSVARLTITTRQEGSSIGWRLTGGEDLPQPVVAPVGTRVEVRDLFFITPARLKFLKTDRSESHHTMEVLKRLAMAHPDVAFTLKEARRPVLEYHTNGLQKTDPFQRLRDVLGKEFVENSVPLRESNDTYFVQGLIGLPILNFSSTKYQYLFVNRRPVQAKPLLATASLAYREYLAKGRYPFVILFLELAPQDVDVNVHPSKAEVRFKDPNLVHSFLTSVMRSTLQEKGSSSMPILSKKLLASFKNPTRGTFISHIAHGEGPDWVSSPKQTNLFMSFDTSRQKLSGLHVLMEKGEPSVRLLPKTRSPFLGMALVQIDLTYILSITEQSLIVVDQHAAHERFVYEELKKILSRGVLDSLKLLEPEIVVISIEWKNLLLAHQEELKKFGLIIRDGQGETVLVSEIPSLLALQEPESISSLIRDLADDLSSLRGQISLQARLEKVLTTMACYGSLRSGHQLSIDEMNTLLRCMERTPKFSQCMHGRPTYIELEKADVRKLFKR